MQLTVLGSGCAFGSAGANAAYCLDGSVLVDCGGPVHQLAPQAGISLREVRTLLVTHFHYDHVADFPLLAGARSVDDPQPAPLRLAGPPGTREYLLRLLRVGYGGRLTQLIDGLLHLDVEVLGDGDDVSLDGYRVRPHAVVHSTGPSLAYAVTGPDGVTVGFSGDTTDCAGLHRCSEQSDLMVVECTGWDGPVPSHLWAGEVRALVTAHPRTRFVASHLAERRQLGGAIVAHDGLTLDVTCRQRRPVNP